MWLERAEGCLALAAMAGPGVLFEDLCYQAQQAAEKALKALLLARTGTYPFVHDLDLLLEKLDEGGMDLSHEVEAAGVLTRYAVETRYPGMYPAVTAAEHQEALRLAGAVLHWVRSNL